MQLYQSVNKEEERQQQNISNEITASQITLGSSSAAAAAAGSRNSNYSTANKAEARTVVLLEHPSSQSQSKANLSIITNGSSSGDYSSSSLVQSQSNFQQQQRRWHLQDSNSNNNSIKIQVPKVYLVNNLIVQAKKLESVPLYISSTIDIIDQQKLEVRAVSNINVNSRRPPVSSTVNTTNTSQVLSKDPKVNISNSVTKGSEIASPSSWLLPKDKFMDIQSLHPILKSFLIGSVSGTCSTILFQPLDLVKTRLQQTPIRYAAAATVTGATATSAAATIPVSQVGIFTLMGHIVRDEKIIGLWKGMTPALTRCVPGVGLYFASIHSLKLSCGITNRDPTAIESVCLGVVGRSFSGVAMIPFTVIKTRYESDYYQYKNMRSALSTIYTQEGFKGLTSGLIPTLLRDAPFSGIYLMMYTSIKKCVPNQYWTTTTTITTESDSSSTTTTNAAFVPYIRFSCGILAGLGASLITQPADVIKTKMQLFPTKFNSIPSVIIYVYQKYGMQGYFKGLVPRMMRRTLVASMSWTIYEQLMANIGLK